MNPINRRNALKTTLLGTAASLLAQATSQAKSEPTPTDIEGPFYPVTQQKDKDFDLTQVEGREVKAKGDVITISGRVLNTDGQPIEDAMVEIWQANAVGRYAHPGDSSKLPLDPNFQGWAVVPSGKNGEFSFKTIKPGSYAAGRGRTRPPHIHLKVRKLDYQPLTTQMYFPEEKKLNESDTLLQRKTKAEQAMMIAKAPKAAAYLYDIILAEIDAPNKAPQQD